MKVCPVSLERKWVEERSLPVRNGYWHADSLCIKAAEVPVEHPACQ
jgi:hypothetical protein